MTESEPKGKEMYDAKGVSKLRAEVPVPCGQFAFIECKISRFNISRSSERALREVKKELQINRCRKEFHSPDRKRKSA